MKRNKSSSQLNSLAIKRKSCNQVIPMELTLTRSLNGMPVTQDELKSYTFKIDSFGQILNAVNERINKLQTVTPNDDGIKSS